MRISNYVMPPNLLPLPSELIQKIATYLDVADLKVLSRLNRQGKNHAAASFIDHARDLGYEENNYKEAIQYINQLFKEVNKLTKQKIISQEYLSYKGKKLEAEKTLQNLLNISTHEIFVLLSKKILYSPLFYKFKKFFILRWKGEITKTGCIVAEKRGSTSLVLAARNGDKNTVKFLLQQGADPSIPYKSGSFALHYAAQAGFEEIVEMLIENGAQVNEKSTGYHTALLFACGFGNMFYHKANAKVVEILLNHGANPHLPDRHGSYPLHHAAQRGLADIVELLLKNGARVNERADGYNTALAFACGYGDTERYQANVRVVEILLGYGADPSIPTEEGQTTAQLAQNSDLIDILSVLRK